MVVFAFLLPRKVRNDAIAALVVIAPISVRKFPNALSSSTSKYAAPANCFQFSVSPSTPTTSISDSAIPTRCRNWSGSTIICRQIVGSNPVVLLMFAATL